MKHHKHLTTDKWKELSLPEQMANIGSEVFRSLSWKDKGNDKFSQLAFERSLELLELSLDVATSYSSLKELARVKEMWGDFYTGRQQFNDKREAWEKYFMQFTYAARNRSASGRNR
jgi:hypothetical protein